MKRHMYLSQLLSQPWAIEPTYLSVASRVIARVMANEEVTAEDREQIDRGKAQHEARTKQSQQYAGGSVAIVQVLGPITQRGEFMDMSTPTVSADALTATLKALAADPQIGAIILDIDSPGGSVAGIQELGDAIFEARSSKPIAAIANSLAASAAYWIGSQAGEFYAAPGALVGSIGVYSMYVDESQAIEKAGYSIEYISAGKYKTEARGLGPLSDDARAHMQAMIDDYYTGFVKAVAQGRGASMKAVREGMGQGRLLLPGAAQAENMIDGEATLAQVVTKMQAKIKRQAKSGNAHAREREILINELG
jgi:signal peptide peptidase SppA